MFFVHAALIVVPLFTGMSGHPRDLHLDGHRFQTETLMLPHGQYRDFGATEQIADALSDRFGDAQPDGERESVATRSLRIRRTFWRGMRSVGVFSVDVPIGAVPVRMTVNGSLNQNAVFDRANGQLVTGEGPFKWPDPARSKVYQLFEWHISGVRLDEFVSVPVRNLYMNKGTVLAADGTVYSQARELLSTGRLKLYWAMVWDDKGARLTPLCFENGKPVEPNGTPWASPRIAAISGYPVLINGQVQDPLKFVVDIDDVEHLFHLPTVAGVTSFGRNALWLSESRTGVKTLLGGSPIYLEFPDGAHANDVRADLKKAGYSERPKDKHSFDEMQFEFRDGPGLWVRFPRARRSHLVLSIKGSRLRIYGFSVQGDEGRRGVTLEEVAAYLKEEGEEDGRIVGSGTDVEIFHNGQSIAASERARNAFRGSSAMLHFDIGASAGSAPEPGQRGWNSRTHRVGA